MLQIPHKLEHFYYFWLFNDGHRDYLNSALQSEGTSATFTTSMFELLDLLELPQIFANSSGTPSRLLKLETYILRNPRRAASMMRRSVCATGRISPLRPISPAKQTSAGIAKSKLDESTALITAKSQAGSLTLSPQATFLHLKKTPAI